VKKEKRIMSERYNYAEAVRKDCERKIREIAEGKTANDRYFWYGSCGMFALNYDDFEEEHNDFYEFVEYLYNGFLEYFPKDDSITGYHSGCYYNGLDKEEAKQIVMNNLTSNLKLMNDICNEENITYCSCEEETDVIIRQYMVKQELRNAMENCKEELERFYWKTLKEETEMLST
jgi:hypothetical protein